MSDKFDPYDLIDQDWLDRTRDERVRWSDELDRIAVIGAHAARAHLEEVKTIHRFMRERLQGQADEKADEIEDWIDEQEELQDGWESDEVM